MARADARLILIEWQMNSEPTDIAGPTSEAQLWSQRFRDPMLLLPLASRLLEQADDDRTRAAARLHMAWGHRYRGEAEAAQSELAVANGLYEASGDIAGLANCRDLSATLLSLERRHDEALALLRSNLALPSDVRTPVGLMITHDRCGLIHDQLGDRDESLRHRYAVLHAARASGDAAAISFALAILGGVQADLYNLDDADRLCAEGLALADSVGAIHAWSLAALNHMNALLAMERGAEAARHAERLLALEPRLNQRAVEQRLIVYADAFTSTGDPLRAQALLDRSASLRSRSHQSLISFTTAQIRAWNAQHLHGRARALGEAYLADPDNGSDPAQVPTELLRILQGLSTACESLGDLAAALRYQKQAFAVHESLVGRSARARRLTLEIQHELDRERWQREHAQRRQQDAEREGVRLNALNHQLDAALQARTRFLAAASHDLRQPAHALALYAVALEQETSREAMRTIARRVRATVSSLSAMFDGLIELARLDAGTVELRAEEFELDELLSRLRTEYADRQPGARAGIALRTAAQPLRLRTDAVLLERILRNLIGNALKYAGDANIVIAIRWRRAGWAIEVRDGGPGIAAADQPRVFDEFFQAATSGVQRDGLGLGLAIVQRFSRLLGITVALRSAPGRGSVFRLEIPAAMAQRAPRTLGAPAAMQPESAVPLRLLVIEDDADARESLTLVLRQWRHEVLAAADLASALDLLNERAAVVDAVISDYQLAGADAASAATGAQAITAVRELQASQLPALLISGTHDEAVRIAATAIGAALLSKPLRPLRLKSWLSTVGRRASADEAQRASQQGGIATPGWPGG